MPDASYPIIALAVVVLLITGMVVVFARRSPWSAPFRDPQIGELVAEIKALRARINALAEAQDRVLCHLESAEARQSSKEGPKP